MTKSGRFQVKLGDREKCIKSDSLPLKLLSNDAFFLTNSHWGNLWGDFKHLSREEGEAKQYVKEPRTYTSVSLIRRRDIRLAK